MKLKDYLTESNRLTTRWNSGTSAIHFLSFKDGEQGVLKTAVVVKNAQEYEKSRLTTSYESVNLPKGTILKKLPGGLVAILKNGDKFFIKQDEDTLIALDKSLE
jgi:hypothetical protein